MKKMKIITLGLTGALAVTTAVTAFAAPAINTTAGTSVLKFSETQVESAELPELPADFDGELPELPADFDGELPELPNFSVGKDEFCVPNLKPDMKPEDEDLVPPEFEGIENIGVIGRPEIPNGEMPGQSEGGESFGGEMPAEMGEAPAEMGEMGEMPGQSEGGESFGGEMPL